MKTVSIIIPTYNEAENIVKLIQHLVTNSNSSVVDLIVSDGGSEDNTVELAKSAGAKVVISPLPGRSTQMNYGAAISKGEVLYFVHADCFPPVSFVKDIQQAIKDGYKLGRYRTRFASNSLFLKLNAWVTRFDFFVCMGGDQTLFIRRSLFKYCNGFKENMRIMEDYELSERARKFGNYKILKGHVLISARKYETNSWLQVQVANSKIVSMYKKGCSQQEILNVYRQKLRYRKNAFHK